MLNIKIFFVYEKFKNITIQQFSEWFNNDHEQLIKFSILSSHQIKQIATHPLLLSYISSLYKNFGFPNINEVKIILKKHRNNIHEQKNIVRKIIVLNLENVSLQGRLALYIQNTRVHKNLPHMPFVLNLDALTISGHLLLTYMHDRHVTVTNRFLLWISRIPYVLFECTCQKMLVF